MRTHRLRRRGSTQLLLTGALTWLVAGCAASVSGSPDPVYAERGRDQHGPPLGVPRGHLPPPGACRIWYRGEPPGQQPPPQPCHEAMASAPPGSWVLYRPRREEVHARVLDRRRAGVVVQVRVYAAENGRYLRSEQPRLAPDESD